MVICHQCSAENSDLQPFCEHCGASLSRWWAIVQGYPGVQKFYDLQDNSDLLTPTSALCVDPQRRYCFLEAPTSINYLPTETEAMVWELHTQVFDRFPHQETAFSTPGKMQEVSPYVQVYFLLQKKFPIAIPKVHNAWQLDGQSVLLVQDRSHLPLLWDVCLQGTVPLLQLLRWFQEMLHLWLELKPWGSLRSVLEISNIRVDTNQRLCLQRLYTDPNSSASMTQFHLKDLGHVWEKLLQAASFGFYDPTNTNLSAQVSSLITCVTTNMIPSTEDLEIMLGEMMQEVQEQLLIQSIQSSSTGDISMRSTLPGIDPIELQHQEELLDILSLPTDDIDVLGNSNVAMFMDQSAGLASGSELGEDRLDKDAFVFQTAADPEDEGFDVPTTILPMRLSALEVVSLTDLGKQRNHNEDFFSAETEVTETASPRGRSLQAKGLYILCDGMGGHAGGEVASEMAAETLQQFFHNHWQGEFPSPEMIAQGIFSANTAIHSINKQRASSGNSRMGTTVVMALLQDTHLSFAHVGDSRLYRVTRKQGLECLTTDHEVGQREIQRGVSPELAYARPDAYQLTQALGPRDSGLLKPDVQSITIREDSLFLLCSDGLTDNDLLEGYWQSHLLPLLSSKAKLEEGMQMMVDLANQYNGHDNISVVAIRIKVLPDLAFLSSGVSR